MERALLAMLAQRALAPDSKLAGSRWAGGRAWIPGLDRGGEELEVQHFYRAMDFLESRRLHYLVGSKLRDGAVVQAEVLSLRGRYGKVIDTVGVKETRITDGGREVRYLLCRDTDRASGDRAVRREIVARLEAELEGSDTANAHTRKACKLLARKGYARYLRETEGGGLEIDRAQVKADERFDGKYVLMRLRDSEIKIWNSFGVEAPPKTLQVTT